MIASYPIFEIFLVESFFWRIVFQSKWKVEKWPGPVDAVASWSTNQHFIVNSRRYFSYMIFKHKRFMSI